MNIAQAKRSFEKTLLGAFRDVAFEIHAKIVQRTPIDTGRAKASWRLNPDTADTSVEPLLADKVNPIGGAIIEKAGPNEHPLYSNQAAAVARAQQQKIREGTKRIVISNNLDYIEKLENGTSQQAPAGMVAVTIVPDAVAAMFTRELAARERPF